MTGPVIGDDGDSSMTHSQSLIGSPHYMAPEQMRSARDVDARADVWALGATLHKMVTGKAPFRGDSVVAIFETMLAGYPGLGASHPEIPAAFATVIERCLQLEPADRAQSVAEVAEALAPFAPVRAHHLVERVVGTLANPVDSSQSFPSVGGGPSSVSQPVVSAVSEASKALAREATSATAMGEHTGATQAAWGQVASSRGRARWPLGVA
ncbi:MAG: protein kinase, partial [Myxococcales bacterium]|nr:protein kinase [Myxococcales bacterium]